MKRRHAHPEDRNRAPLRPRRELFEAIVAYAVHVSQRRRRQAKKKRAPIALVAAKGQIWAQPQPGQPKLLERCSAHLAYLDLEPPSLRTLRRHIAGFRRTRYRDKRRGDCGPILIVGNYSRFDRTRQEWLQTPNVYTITRAGILWITRHAKALKIPRFL